MMLQVKDLVVSYGAINALRGISFDVNEGEIITLGPLRHNMHSSYHIPKIPMPSVQILQHQTTVFNFRDREMRIVTRIIEELSGGVRCLKHSCCRCIFSLLIKSKVRITPLTIAHILCFSCYLVDARHNTHTACRSHKEDIA